MPAPSDQAPTPRAERARQASTSRDGAVPAVLLVAGCVLTALAAHHSSRAQGGVLLIHLVAGLLGLLLPLAGVAWVVRSPHPSARRSLAAVLCAGAAVAVAAVALALLAWLALASGLNALG